MTKIVDSLFDDICEELSFFDKIYYPIVRKFTEFKYFVRSTYQRFRYGFPLYEVWNFKVWHSTESAKRLKYLRKNLNGHPTTCSSIEEWESILDEIIWTFENHDHPPLPVYSDDYDHRYEVTEMDGMRSYRSMNKTGTINNSNRDKHYERVRAGLDLFAKYYLNLWD